MPSRTIADAEYAFLKQMLGVTVGQIDDLRLRFYEGVLNGTVAIGAQKTLLNAVGNGNNVPLTNPTGSGVSASLNRGCFGPFYIQSQTKISTLGVRVSAAGTAGATVRFGLWGANPTTGLMDYAVKYAESGEVASTTTGIKTMAAALTLAPGLYYAGAVFHTAVCSLAAAKTPFDLVNLADTTQTFPFMFQDGITGAFPASGAPNLNGDYIPLLYGTLAP